MAARTLKSSYHIN